RGAVENIRDSPAGVEVAQGIPSGGRRVIRLNVVAVIVVHGGTGLDHRAVGAVGGHVVRRGGVRRRIDAGEGVADDVGGVRRAKGNLDIGAIDGGVAVGVEITGPGGAEHEVQRVVPLSSLDVLEEEIGPEIPNTIALKIGNLSHREAVVGLVVVMVGDANLLE